MKPSSNFVLVVSVLGAVGGWAVTLNVWAAATTPAAVGGLMLVLASTLSAAYGVNKGGNQ